MTQKLTLTARFLPCLFMVAALLFPSMASAAEDALTRQLCEKRARDLSGYEGGLIPSMRIGNFTLELHGSVQGGVVKEWGNGSAIKTPPNAGAGAEEKRRLEREAKYKEILQECMSSN